MSNKRTQDLEQGKILPRGVTQTLADALDAPIKGAAQFWGRGNLACGFFFHQPKLPKKLQDPQDLE